MSKNLITTISTLIIFSCLLSVTKAEDGLIKYPDGYRYWTHVKSMVIQEGHSLHDTFGGIHHLYANDKALKGYQIGDFPEGAVIIFDLLEATTANNAIVENKRKVLGVMVKDSKQFSDTAGWGFEGFVAGDPENRAVGNDYKEACFACHTVQKDSDYVFSKWRD